MSSEVWLPIATLVLGVVLSQGATWLNQKWELRQQREERWRTFQRETVLEAQDVTGELYKRAHEYRITMDHFQGEGDDSWPSMLEVSQDMYRRSIRLSSLIERVEDEDLREALLGVYRSALANEWTSRDDEFANAVIGVNDRVRLLLPKLH